jgi:hypothetical protein
VYHQEGQAAAISVPTSGAVTRTCRNSPSLSTRAWLFFPPDLSSRAQARWRIAPFPVPAHKPDVPIARHADNVPLPRLGDETQVFVVLLPAALSRPEYEALAAGCGFVPQPDAQLSEWGDFNFPHYSLAQLPR